MSATLAATLFYLFVIPWVCVAIMWDILPKLENDHLADMSHDTAITSGQTLARAFAPNRSPVINRSAS